jgi:ParB/RepB/Spo0J family partition protein
MADELAALDLSSLVYSGQNPREDLGDLTELTKSIKIHGVLEPILVRLNKGKYEIIAGARRVKASELAGLKTIPAIVKEISDAEASVARLIENIQREDLTSPEKGDAVLGLLQNHFDKYPTWVSIAKALSVSPQALQSWLRSARRASPFVKESLASSKLHEYSAHRLLKYDWPTQDKLAKVIMVSELTDRQAMRFFDLYDKAPEGDLEDYANQVQGKKTISIHLDELPKKLRSRVEKAVSERRQNKFTEETRQKAAASLRDTNSKKKEAQVRAGQFPLFQEPDATQSAPTVENAGQPAGVGGLQPAPTLERITSPSATTESQPSKITLPSIEVPAEKYGQAQRLLERIEKIARAPKAEPFTRKPMPNLLNEMDGDEWLRFTISWYVFDALVSDLDEEKAIIGNSEDHPATFSPTMVSDYIRFFTKSGATVLDPFVGIGSTLAACSRTERRGIGIDINPKYCEMSKKRVNGDSNQQVICANSFEVETLDLPQIDYCITSPPYFTMLNKIDATQRQRRIEKGLPTNYGDAVNIEGNLSTYISNLVVLFNKIAKLMPDKSYLTVILQNFRDKQRMVPLAWYLAIELDKVGPWVFKGEKIWCQAHKLAHPYGQKFEFVSNVHHHYCLIFRKEAGDVRGKNNS